jgi:hypothetical protein
MIAIGAKKIDLDELKNKKLRDVAIKPSLNASEPVRYAIITEALKDTKKINLFLKFI